MARTFGATNFKPTPEQREQVEMLAAIGVPHEVIAQLVKNSAGNPISVDTLTKHFADELVLGLHKANSMMAGRLYRVAMGRNEKATAADELRAIMFWLNTRGGFATTAKVETSEADEDQDEVAVAAKIAGLLEKGKRLARKAGGSGSIQ